MGTGSFFGDGKSDILLQNNDGSVALWDMNGTTILGGGLVASDPGPTWHIEGTAGGLTITPGSGSFTDAAGNIYTLSADGVAEINGSAVPDFGGTGSWRTTTATFMVRMPQPAIGLPSISATTPLRDRPPPVSSATVTPASSYRTMTGRSRCGT